VSLYETSQIERAAKYFLSNSNSIENKNSSNTTSSSNSVPYFKFPSFGTKDRPLHIITEGSTSGNWSRRFSTLVNVVIVSAILYSIFSMNDHKIGGISSNFDWLILQFLFYFI
jgi:hypothetical protein